MRHSPDSNVRNLFTDQYILYKYRQTIFPNAIVTV
jgi:hypothetical protein